jgi:hypothetical protein
MFRPTKRQRQQQNPTCWMDCETLTVIPSPPSFQSSVVRTAIASQHLEDIFLERFQKEIVQKCFFSLSPPPYLEAEDNHAFNSKRCRILLKQRILVGTNACTRALEAAAAAGIDNAPPKKQPSPAVLKPLLVVVVVAGDSPSLPVVTPWVHIPVLTHTLTVPLLLLSSSASPLLARLLRAKKVSVLTFLPATPDGGTVPVKNDKKCTEKEEIQLEHKDGVGEDADDDDDRNLHKSVDSFVEFILKKKAVPQETQNRTEK